MAATYSHGSSGNTVKKIQNWLNQYGYNTGGDTLGSYGAGTQDAVNRLQADYGKDSLSVFSGVSMTNEKCYLTGKFAHGDGLKELRCKQGQEAADGIALLMVIPHYKRITDLRNTALFREVSKIIEYNGIVLAGA